MYLVQSLGIIASRDFFLMTLFMSWFVLSEPSNHSYTKILNFKKISSLNPKSVYFAGTRSLRKALNNIANVYRSILKVNLIWIHDTKKVVLWFGSFFTSVTVSTNLLSVYWTFIVSHSLVIMLRLICLGFINRASKKWSSNLLIWLIL